MSNEQTTSFAASGEDAITRTIDVEPDQAAEVLSPDQFNDFYDIERTANEIVDGDYKRIALQFPDELLHDSVPIFRRLSSRIGTERQLYVLADTSYGSCCVDEVAASHVDADAMVHYGHACMSQTSRLPVIYVFGRKDLDVEICVNKLLSIFDSNNSDGDARRAILLKYDVAYAHRAGSIFESLKQKVASRNIPVHYHEIYTKTQPATSASLISVDEPPSTSIPPEYTTIFYVGSESLGLTNLLMTNASCTVYSFDPRSKTARLESGRTNRLLMRRYAVVQKTRDADVFGILVGTLGIASYLPLIKHLRALLAKNQKKSYTISVGKLNPSKLANFLEIECFVLVACPENSLIEAKDFLRPIVTPYELEVALQAEQSWTGRYVLDFGQLLSDAGDNDDKKEVPSKQDGEEEEKDPDQPVFSLITGTYRHAKRFGGTKDDDIEQKLVEGTSALVLRNQDNALTKLDSAAGQFLQQRTYQGLDLRLGEDAPSVLEQGRSGIARGYQDDRSHQDMKTS